MALSLDTQARIPATALTTTTAAASASYTCGANARVLVVMVLYAGVTARTGGAPTYNSVGLTQAETRQGVTEASCELWYLIDPPVSQSLTINVPNDNGRTMWVYVASGNAGAGMSVAFDDGGVNATTAASPTVTVVTTVNGCLIFAVVATGDNTFAPTARTGTSLYEEDIAAYGGAAQYLVKADSGSQAMTWTEATSDDYGAVAAAFREVTGPVNVALDTASLVGAGVAVTISAPPPAQVITLDAAALLASGVGCTIVAQPPAQTVVLDSAALVAAGVGLSVNAPLSGIIILLDTG